MSSATGASRMSFVLRQSHCTIASWRCSISPSASHRCYRKFPSVRSTSRTDSDQPINIVGAGLAGALLGVMLMRRGRGEIRMWDRRPDPRRARTERGRSINLALAARGIRALEHAGVMHRIRPLLIPMRGRMIHDRSGTTALQPYGQRDDEVIYSVGRAALNLVLIDE